MTEKDEANLLAARAFFNALPRTLKERIAGAARSSRYYSIYGGIGTDSVSIHGLTSCAFGELPEYIRETILDRLPPSYRDVSTLLFENDGASISVKGVTQSGKVRDLDLDLLVSSAGMNPTISLNHEFLSGWVQRFGRTAPSSWRYLDSMQRQVVWGQRRVQPRETSYPWRRRAYLLRKLSNKGGLNIVADYFSQPCRPLSPSEEAKPIKGGVEDELNRIAAEQDLSWKRSAGKVVLVRNNRWYRDDRLEPPDRLIKILASTRPAFPDTWRTTPPSVAQIQYYVRSQADWYAKVVSTLTPWQLANGFAFYVDPAHSSLAESIRRKKPWQPYYWVSATLLPQLDEAQFYVNLTPSERNAVFKGKLAVSALAPARLRRAADVVSGLREALQRQPARSLLIGLGFKEKTGGISMGYEGIPYPELNLVFQFETVAR